MNNYTINLKSIDTGIITTDDIEAGFEELENNNEQTVEEWLEDFKADELYLSTLIILILAIIFAYIHKKK